MNPRLPHLKRRTALLGVLLILSLLFTQWLGYAHAVSHGVASPEMTKAVQSAGGPSDHAKSASACAALDAATLGAGLHSAGWPPLPALAVNGAVALPLRSGWHRLFSAHFSSRAPPLNA